MKPFKEFILESKEISYDSTHLKEKDWNDHFEPFLRKKELEHGMERVGLRIEPSEVSSGIKKYTPIYKTGVGNHRKFKNGIRATYEEFFKNHKVKNPAGRYWK